MYDVVIIGSGPAGLTAAIYASRAELKTLIIAGTTPGGQLMITSDVENFPGFPEGIMGPELMDRMFKQSTRFGATLVSETATKVDCGSRPLVVETEKNRYETRSVIIASGAEAKWLGLVNEQRLRGHGVTACATCDGFFFRGKEVIVIGGGDSAMEEAIFLTKFATKVTIMHRRGEFRASKIMLSRAHSNPKIVFSPNTVVVDVLGEKIVTGARIKNLETGAESDFKTDGIFLAIGHQPNVAVYQGQLELDDKGYIKVKDDTKTSVPGIFSAGDVNDHRYRQAVTAAGMGCMAAMDAEKWLVENGK